MKSNATAKLFLTLDSPSSGFGQQFCDQLQDYETMASSQCMTHTDMYFVAPGRDASCDIVKKDSCNNPGDFEHPMEMAQA
jgi:hypothetical protein